METCVSYDANVRITGVFISSNVSIKSCITCGDMKNVVFPIMVIVLVYYESCSANWT